MIREEDAVENTVDNQNIDDAEQVKLCPYMDDMSCIEAECPAWIDDFDDCLFRVCMTEVKAEFLKAARFLDGALGWAPGEGEATLGAIRAMITAPGVNLSIIGPLLLVMMEKKAVQAIGNLTVEDIAGAISRADEVIGSAFDNILDFGPEEDEE